MSETKYYDQHGNTYTQSSRFNGFINAFWRRIWGFRNSYDRDLPIATMPVRFRAAMETALSIYPLATVVNNNMPGTQHIIELPPNVTLDVGCKYRLVFVEDPTP